MSGDDAEQDEKKEHRTRSSGRKAEKKKLKKQKVQNADAKERNPKAFTFNSAVRAERRFRRTQDLKSKKEHIPVVDRTPLEPPPILVAIVGPPKVGKSTLIHCLIKSYTRQTITKVTGPVTLVSGKKRRITLIECNNDINSMVDIAKVADLVLLLIDASFGFEMEIFEFLNICQVHGMPKIMGVLTHLDMIKHTKKLQKTKKLLKRRFWTELYPGAKLFYLSGIHHGEYLKNEIKNLARFISVMKFRPLVWQTSHSYLLADRMEDVTPPEQLRLHPKSDRTVVLYGFMRGIPMNQNSFIHIPGCGDFHVSNICFLPDPCPLPEQLKKRSLIEKERLVYAPFSGVGGIVYDKDAVYVEVQNNALQQESNKNILVSTILEAKETIDVKLSQSKVQLFSDTKPIFSSEFEKSDSLPAETCNPLEKERDEGCDKVEEGNNDSAEKKRKYSTADEYSSGDETDDEGESGEEIGESDHEEQDEKCFKAAMERQEAAKYKAVMSEKDKTIHATISGALASLETRSKPPTEDQWSNCSSSNESEDEDEGVGSSGDDIGPLPWDNTDGKDSEESSDEGGEGTDLNWKSNLAQKAAMAFIERQSSEGNLWKLVYGTSNYTPDEESDEQSDDEVGGLFKVLSKKQENISHGKETLDAVDSSKFITAQIRDWSLEEVQNSIKDCFVTGDWKQDDAQELLKLDDMEDSDDELFGDFEDMETGEKFKGKVGTETDEKSPDKKPKEDLTKEQLLEKKKKLKEKFNEEYDTKDEKTYFDELKSEANKQAELNRMQFDGVDDELRAKLEGFRAGMYIRLEINNIPSELVDHFDPSYPLVVGGLQPGEQNIGYVKVRIKKHRWYNRILKTKDPLIISMGWRRFQTLAVYSKQEDNMRFRMLKYTPQHVACMGHFFGPITRNGTGFLALKSVSSDEADAGFRIVASGSVVDTNQSTVVTKKLKLIGTPLKVYKKTAFIKGMFNTVLEVAKFEGAKIKTVSGVRGQIKKAINKPEGAFRATFEDKILLSDIVFCRTWYKVDIPKLYIPITSLLLPPELKNCWKGMKTLGQLKREKDLKNPAQPDSMYTPVVREPKIRKPLMIPRALEKELPYKYKTKFNFAPRSETNSKKKVNGPFMKKVGKIVVRDEYESKVASMMDKLRMSFDVKQEQLKFAMRQRVKLHRKQMKAEEARKNSKLKETRKEIFRSLSKKEEVNKKRHKKRR